MPLILSRKPGESIRIAGDITVTILRIHGRERVFVQIDAPQDVRIVRTEIEEERNA